MNDKFIITRHCHLSLYELNPNDHKSACTMQNLDNLKVVKRNVRSLLVENVSYSIHEHLQTVNLFIHL